ncbi:Nucleotide-binding universal stress protein, UspA family [Ruegeria halocynthiae]|uniref:Nucleotide-binding universal stress protein, UspA family n=1 Tax=Ruegeria halocynthiae TaxID=985054 RepID=A0A1H2RU94_9RHOB|nr:universal stress protein [Ruegeria halocynthiae]SDW22750.1 Nucleotide-binding universal stress protein, UspA family [Ruegeria halocynthiae]
MPEHILIPVALDHENLARRKLDVARRLLDDGGRITLLTVLEEIPGFVAEFVTVKEANNLSENVRSRLREIAADAEDIGIDVISGKAGVRIPEYASKVGVDLIIVGSQKPGATGYFLGSTASRIVRRAECAVYVHR